MCKIRYIKRRLYHASFFLSKDGYYVTLRFVRQNNKSDFTGYPDEIRKQVLWKNAEAGLLGVNYHKWPWYKKLMAHVRISVCKLKNSFSYVFAPVQKPV